MQLASCWLFWCKGEQLPAAGRPGPGTSAPSSSRTPGASPAPGARLDDPARVLSAGWRHSADRVMTVRGDSSGLHVLVAEEASGYQWRTVATLGDPGVQTSLWIGQACLSGNGRYAVVVYAPREVTNVAGAMGALGRAAVVNLGTGAVRQLGIGYSVAYFDPGCGSGDQAVLTRGGWDGDTPALPRVDSAAADQYRIRDDGVVGDRARTGDFSDPLPGRNRRGIRQGSVAGFALRPGAAADVHDERAIPADAGRLGRPGVRDPAGKDSGAVQVRRREDFSHRICAGGVGADVRAGRPSLAHRLPRHVGAQAARRVACGRRRDRVAGVNHRSPGGDGHRQRSRVGGEAPAAGPDAAGQDPRSAADRSAESRHILRPRGRARGAARRRPRGCRDWPQAQDVVDGGPAAGEVGRPRPRRCRPIAPAR